MPIQESGEMYLETIYVLTNKSGRVRSIDICEEMGYSKPSVSRAVGILRKNNYITVDKSGYITLTETGKALAIKIYERHTTITEFLIYLGVEPDVASEDACKMEHVISDSSFKAIKNFSQNK